MSSLADFHFMRPLALLLVLVVPLFWLLWRSGRADAGAWRAAVDPHLLPHLIERIDGGPGRGGIVLAAVLWIIACVALAGPAWEREPMPLYRNQAARVLALELAPTMLAQDEKPNRLARARFKLDDILGRSRDYQTALIGYAGDAFVAAPLTDDVGTVRNLIDALDPTTMPVAGNATARAIATAVSLIEQAGMHSGEIILLADSAGADAVAAARRAHERGMTVSVLGVGNTTGAPVPLAQGDFMKDNAGNVVVSRLDESALRDVATAGGGRFATLTADGRDLDTLLSDRVEGNAADASAASGSELAQSARWRDRGPWLLLLLAPLALLGFRRGWLMAVALSLMTTTPRADAASLADLWQRPDQQAAAALANGDAKQAAAVARTPEWRGGAAYRDGDFEAAAADYATTQNADGAYNKGNALAKLGRYDDALAAYDEALKLAPDMADAKANRQAVEDWKKKQSKSDQKSKSDKGKQDPSKKDSKDQKQDSGGDDSQKQESKDKDQQGQSQDDQKDGQKDGQQGDQQKQDAGSKSDSSSSSDQQKKDDAQKDADKSQQDPTKGESNGGADANEKAQPPQSAQASTEQQKAMQQAMDKALAKEPKPGDQQGQPQAGAVQEDDATREKKQALDHWLQRVPDDPGGLLRRKFQLEYQRRQQRGGDGG